MKMKMKKIIPTFLCLLVVVSIVILASKNTLFNLKLDKLDKIEVRTGKGEENTLNTELNAESISQIISILNNFRYVEKEKMEDANGWYLELNIIYKNRTNKRIEISPNGVISRSIFTDKKTKYISADPEYFGDTFMKLLLNPLE